MERLDESCQSPNELKFADNAFIEGDTTPDIMAVYILLACLAISLSVRISFVSPLQRFGVV